MPGSRVKFVSRDGKYCSTSHLNISSALFEHSHFSNVKPFTKYNRHKLLLGELTAVHVHVCESRLGDVGRPAPLPVAAGRLLVGVDAGGRARLGAAARAGVDRGRAVAHAAGAVSERKQRFCFSKEQMCVCTVVIGISIGINQFMA